MDLDVDDPAGPMGFSRLAGIGAAAGEAPLGYVHAADAASADTAAAALRAAYHVADVAPRPRSPVLEQIGEGGSA